MLEISLKIRLDKGIKIFNDQARKAEHFIFYYSHLVFKLLYNALGAYCLITYLRSRPVNLRLFSCMALKGLQGIFQECNNIHTNTA